MRPRFEQVSLLGADEDALHPIAEALFGHMLMGARSTIAVDRPMTGEESSLPELLETDWQTLIAATIRQGYTRRLNTLQGFSAHIGDVQVDLGHGLLQLFDVEIDTDHPVLEHPLTRRAVELIPAALLGALVAVQVLAADGRLVVDARLAALGVAAVLLVLRVPFLGVVAAAALTAALLRL